KLKKITLQKINLYTKPIKISLSRDFGDFSYNFKVYYKIIAGFLARQKMKPALFSTGCDF
ncbi:MAG: hypothetical protein IKO39_10855, partial [Treponema sp.]|nr:hypothetical protein [Treponema sp.]